VGLIIDFEINRVTEGAWEGQATLHKPEPPPVVGFPLWSQRQEPWAGELVGYGPSSTFAKWGCLVTAAAMGVSKLLDRLVTPLEFNEALKEVNGFQDDAGVRGRGNLMRFAAIWERWPEIKGAGHYDFPYPKPATPDVMIPVLERGGFALVKVDFDPKDTDVDQHWVLVTGYAGDGVFTIHDPWPLPDQQRELLLPPAYAKTGWSAKEIIFRISQYELKARG
jgi:hypothetical protein